MLLERDDLPALAHAALVDPRLEMIHPFADLDDFAAGIRPAPIARRTPRRLRIADGRLAELD